MDSLGVRLHAEQERCAIALGGPVECRQPRLREDACADCHTNVALDEANVRADIASSTTVDACKTANICNGCRQDETVYYLWRMEKCDVRIKSREARDIQLEALGAARECRTKLVVRWKPARVDDDSKDELDEEVVLDACFFPHRTASPGVSLLRRRTERNVLRDSRDKRGTQPFAEGDAIHVLCAIVTIKTVRLWMVRAGSQVVCDNCRR